jgi:hypothetical protein
MKSKDDPADFHLATGDGALRGMDKSTKSYFYCPIRPQFTASPNFVPFRKVKIRIQVGSPTNFELVLVLLAPKAQILSTLL